MSFSLLVSKEGRDAVLEVATEKSFIITTGFISLMLGLPVIILHNIWTFDVVGFITFIGWMSVVKGVIRIAKPSVVARMTEKFDSSSKTWLVIALLIGAGLMYAGYYPYWC
jgi:hypothetical protein